jgi:hypothetical protein
MLDRLKGDSSDRAVWGVGLDRLDTQIVYSNPA